MIANGSRRAARRVRQILDTALPRHCVLCGRASGGANLCPGCHAELPRLQDGCSFCALSLALPGDRVCGACLRKPPPWDRAVAALDYRFPVDRLVHRFKFSRDFASGAVLAAELLGAVDQALFPAPACIVPVPLHWSRQLRRGFNQSDLLATRLGRSLGLAVDRRLLRRLRRTLAQSELDAAGRRRNIRGAFSAAQAGLASAVPDHVALVDDVCTTGETLADCSRALRRIGVAEISVWIAARAPGPERLPH